MKYLYTILITLLTISNSYSQNENASHKITYIASLDNNGFKKSLQKNDLSKKSQHFLNQLTKSKGDIEYTLVFNNNKSFFSKDKKMNNDGKRQTSITEIIAGKGIFYTEKNELILHQKESFGEPFLITYPKTKWELTKETKKIGNYNCNKAIGIKIIENKKGIIEKEIIAWYTSEISIGFGPKEFSGLPGLILELHEGKLIFKAIKVELNSKTKIDIIKPIKGEKVTLKKHYELMRKASSDYFREKKAF
ncbi:GLPGLI family protein [Tenacibaculum aquimarinum]|uniref:GLPGLI family protein n=1 Tax=Tenacibaculum aquimarinum TaxID=2910675 RepID=UPI001F0AE208|nr:GLPGLI family protein [Tenacibaculum aquimarinum]MCH3881580.1 GLPGLI family protein [Tenacibaculum aquimarinum]